MAVDNLENARLRPFHEFSGKNVLVTGGSGFIGTHLCRRLRREGAEVNAISRLTHSSDDSGPRWWQGDLSEITTTRKFLTTIKPDVIFDLCGYPVGARELDHVIPSFRSNLMSTLNILTAATEAGCQRIVLAGSLEEPKGANPQVIPSSPYAVAKWAASAYARMFHALYDLPVVILRVFMVYGPGEQPPNKLIPYVTRSLLQGKVPRLASGERKIDWIYVEDVVGGFLAGASANNIEGQTIDVGSGKARTIRTIVDHITRLITPKIKPLFNSLPDRPFEQERVADRARSLDMMGWRPTTSLEEGLKQTVEWYKAQKKETAS